LQILDHEENNKICIAFYDLNALRHLQKLENNVETISKVSSAELVEGTNHLALMLGMIQCKLEDTKLEETTRRIHSQNTKDCHNKSKTILPKEMEKVYMTKENFLEA
jgi:hypothetical protein